MGPPSTIWQTSNKLAAAIDIVVETMYGTNLSLTPPTPSMKATSDNDTVEEAQFAEYYYDGETQPFSFSPEQLLATTDTNVRPTPSNHSLRSNPETLPDTQEKTSLIPQKNQKIKKQKTKKEKKKKKKKKKIITKKTIPPKKTNKSILAPPVTSTAIYSATQETMIAQHRLHQYRRHGPTIVLPKTNLEYIATMLMD